MIIIFEISNDLYDLISFIFKTSDDCPEGINNDEKAIVLKLHALIEKSKKISSKTHQSHTFAELFQAKQSELKLSKHNLIQSVDTRWNSTYIMLERLYEQVDAVNQALMDKNAKAEKSLYISDDEKLLMNGYLEVLSCFYEATNEFSVSKYVSISIILPTFNSIISNLQEDINDSQIVSILKKLLLKSTEFYIDKYKLF